MSSRPRRTCRQFVLETKEGLLIVLAQPGQSWKDAFAKARAAYEDVCQALGEAPLPMTVIDRVKL